MLCATPPDPASECEQILALLARFPSPAAAKVLTDAQEIRLLLARYSFRTPQLAERFCAEVSSRYRREILSLYGAVALSRRQSESCYLRLEQLLPLLARVAALRLCREGALPFSPVQLTQGDGMLLKLLRTQ